MPNIYRENRISDKYKRRIKALRGQTVVFRAKAGVLYVKLLQEATEVELYKQSPYNPEEVSRDMYNSIGARYVATADLEIGYFMPDGVKNYAPYRLNMIGPYKYTARSARTSAGIWPYPKDMHPARYMRNRGRHRLETMRKQMLKNILEV